MPTLVLAAKFLAPNFDNIPPNHRHARIDANASQAPHCEKRLDVPRNCRRPNRTNDRANAPSSSAVAEVPTLVKHVQPLGLTAEVPTLVTHVQRHGLGEEARECVHSCLETVQILMSVQILSPINVHRKTFASLQFNALAHRIQKRNVQKHVWPQPSKLMNVALANETKNSQIIPRRALTKTTTMVQILKPDSASPWPCEIETLHPMMP